VVVKVGLRWLIIAAPILVAKAFGVFEGYFSQTSFVVVGLSAAFALILAATFAETRLRRKNTH
jgi:uncharacterized membrane protein YuzA (DUF378 family)